MDDDATSAGASASVPNGGAATGEMELDSDKTVEIYERQLLSSNVKNDTRQGRDTKA